MAYAFEIGDELPDPPTLAEVEADIADWKVRLADLMALLTQWAQEIPDVEVECGSHEMRERKLALVGIQRSVQLPALLIKRLVETIHMPAKDGYRTSVSRERVLERHEYVTVRPDARWVVGTRGQILIWAPRYPITVMDLGELGRPDWRFLSLSDYEFVPITKEWFQNLIKALK